VRVCGEWRGLRKLGVAEMQTEQRVAMFQLPKSHKNSNVNSLNTEKQVAKRHI